MLSEQTFKSLFNNSVDAIVVVDIEKERIASANEVFCQKTGYSHEEVHNLTFKDLHCHEDLPRAIECFRTSAAGRLPIARGLPFRTKNGSIFYVDITCIDIYFDNKKYLMGIFRDVTNQKKIEDELALQSLILETQLEMALDGILILDDKGNVLLANKRMSEMWNVPQKLIDSYNYDEASRHILSMLKEPEKHESIFKDLYKNKEAKQRLEIELKDGRIFDRYTAPVLDSNGKYMGRIWFFSDISDYRKIERELKENEERYRLAIEATSNVLWDWNRVTNKVYQNPYYSIMLGYEPGEINDILSDWLERIHPEDKPFVINAFNESVKNNVTCEVEYRLRKKSGEYIWILGRGKFVEHDEKGMPLRMVGTLTNISERKKIQEELERERYKLRSIMKVINRAVTIFDLDYTVVYLNDYAKKFNAVLEGQKCYQVFTGRERICDNCLVEMVYEDGNSHSSTKFITLPSGEQLWWENTASPIRDDNGRIIYCLEVGKDVTERVQAQEALRESEERFRNIVENTGLSMATFDENGKLIYINNSGAKDMGNSPEELIGKTVLDIFPKEMADFQMRDIQHVINTSQRIIRRNVPLKNLGKVRWYDVLVDPLNLDENKVKSVIAIGRDITELKLAHEKIDQYREKMAHAEQLASLGTLIAEAAHELTQPLTVINLSIENTLNELRKTRYPKTVKQKLEMCMSEVSHIKTVINKFRNFARKSSEQNLCEIDFKTIAEMNITLLREIAERAKITLSIEGLEALPHITASERDMQQLFFCLIENAIHAADGKEENRLDIKGTSKDEQIELRFCDNCGGIAPENLDKIFEPFFTTKPINQGTGLGLCIVQDIVSRAGGKIRVESKWTEGSTFTVTLPLNNNLQT
jgi:PAS domain S-box-containing protein